MHVFEVQNALTSVRAIYFTQKKNLINKFKNAMLKLRQKWTSWIFIVYSLFLLTAMAHEEGQGIILKMKIFKAMTN